MIARARIVFDSNCLIDLEERRPAASSMDVLIAAAHTGRIDLAVTAVTASENQPGGGVLCNFEDYMARLSRLGLADAHLLLPLAIWDVGYWDHAIFGSDELNSLAVRIRGVLFPGEEPGDYSANAMITAKWRRRQCDAMVAWCCIYHGWECLVTSDNDFRAHRKELSTLGLSSILSPGEAVAVHAT